jgi:hypothetical protein
MTGRKLIHWLKAQGAKPLEEAESDRIEQEHLRLQKSGARGFVSTSTRIPPGIRWRGSCGSEERM